jgi:hypothetical protein
MNTLALNAGEIKGHLQEQANDEGRDLSSPDNRFTIWSENGNAGFSYEDHAEHAYQIAPKLGTVMLKNKTRGDTRPSCSLADGPQATSRLRRRRNTSSPRRKRKSSSKKEAAVLRGSDLEGRQK